MKVLNKVFKRMDYLWPIMYGLIILCGTIFMPELQVNGGMGLRIILIIGAALLIVLGVIRFRKANIENEEMLNEYEKLFLNSDLSVEEIDSIMLNKYGYKYNVFYDNKLKGNKE